ncbi:hypothetical protein M885DRAFT_501893 [Pelagophyceae sp. CCMP2097]|nr:hypothetical protein M885DRAFT_501893 [Pelagophyceae sp. CCMP2097]
MAPAAGGLFGGAGTYGGAAYGAPQPAPLGGLGGLGGMGAIGGMQYAGMQQPAPLQQPSVTHPYGVGVQGIDGLGQVERGVASLERRGKQLEARLRGAGCSEATALGLDGGHGTPTTPGAGGGAYFTSARRAAVQPRATPQRACVLATALFAEGRSTPQAAQGLASPGAYLSLSHRRLVIDPDAHSAKKPSLSTRKNAADGAPAAPGLVLALPPPPPLGLHLDAGDEVTFGEDTIYSSHSRTPSSGDAFKKRSAQSPAPATTPTQQLDPLFASSAETSARYVDDSARHLSPGGRDAEAQRHAAAAGDASDAAMADGSPADAAKKNAPPRVRGASAGPNPNAPRLTKVGFTTEPSMAVLERLSDDELAAVSCFAVAREGRGRIEWVGRVDVRGVDLDADVRICERDGPPEVEVYDDAKREKPPVGAKLNRTATITLEHIGPPAGASEADKEKWTKKIAKTTKKIGADLVAYDADERVWSFRTSHF